MSSKCSICGETVTSDFRFYGEKKIHRTCFTCTNCNKQLRLGHLKKIDGKLFCEDCGKPKTGGSGMKCVKCGKPASGMMAKVAGKIYHKTCLKCDTCGKQITSSPIINFDKVNAI
eukprot:Anaeramoba_flamelloidesc40490_g2_i1.p1 GENE.c40490_g2_i1~~c40490_g2_i1.p1  ORF type:complete len:115 (-),score=15.53 c40490_g2_i1:58-402(-)